MMNIKKRGILAGLGAMAAAAALVLGGAVAAQAAPIIPPVTPPTPDTRANLHITKLTTPNDGPVESNGMPNASLPAGASGIPGVVYRVDRITNVDLTTNAGWQTAAQLDIAASGAVTNPGDAGWSATFGSYIEGTTNASGVPQLSGGGDAFQSMPVGLYRVTEYSTPAGVTGSVPFLVALPMTNPVTVGSDAPGTTWLYDVYVYPKNSKVGATKTVDDAAARAAAGTAGGTAVNRITWTVLADIPRDETISKFEIVDALDSRVTYASSTVSITGAGAPALVACVAVNDPVNCDYTLTTGSTVTLAFSAAGRAKLVTAWKANPAAQVKFDIASDINATALGGASDISNTATVSVNNAPSITTLPAIVKVGDIKIHKVTAGTTTGLQGAEFRVYANKADADAANGNYLVINNADKWTTDANGDVTIQGLLFSNWINGATVIDPANYRSYYLVEIKAPADHQLLAEPIKVDVTAAGASVVVTDIENVPTSAFLLPLTGGTGTVLLTVGGIAILAIVLLVARRRRNAEDVVAE